MVMFKKKGFVRAVNEFSPREDIAEVTAFVKQQRVAGELVVSLPGNGGIDRITFREKERPVEINPQNS
jgi:hypothetical protein